MKWFLFYPELYYFAVGMIFLFMSMAKTNNPRRDYFTALFLAVLGVVICLASIRQEGLLFFQAYRVDLFSQVFKVLLSIGLFLIVSICSNLNGVAERYHPEFYLLLFLCTLAMMLLVSSVHILSIYVALELSSYSLYILVALRNDEQIGLEAGLKYFLVGIFASAVMLFGVALLYSTTKATYVTEMIRVLPGVLDTPAVVIGLLLTLCGFFFKLAVFPFHFWAPDVYQGAANQVDRLYRHSLKSGCGCYFNPHGCRQRRRQSLSGPCAGYPRHCFDDGGKSGRHRSKRFQKTSGLFHRCPCRVMF